MALHILPELWDESRTRSVLLIAGAFALGQAIHINNGVIHPAAVAWLTLALVAFWSAMMPSLCRRFRMVGSIPITPMLVGCIAIQWMQLAWDERTTGEWPAMMLSLGCAGAGVIIAALEPKRIGLSLAILIAGHAAAGALTIQSTPRPGIDVWYFQDGSTTALLHGHDPYAVRFRDIYGPQTGFYSPGMAVDGWLTYSYPYPPLMLMATAPGQLFGDVRWAHLAALELAAVLIVLAGVSQRSLLAAAMLLLTPRSLFVIKVGWTEPMVLLAFAGAIYCAAKCPRWLWLALGLLLAIKQYTVVVLPLLFIFNSRRDAIRLCIKASIVAACITLPFFLWNPVSFFRSVVLWQLRQPFRQDALSLTALMDHAMGIQPGMWVCALCTIGAIAWCLRHTSRDLAGFTASLTLMLATFYATNKQAFCNYYFLVIGVTCAAAAMQQARQLASATWQRLPELPRRVAA